MHGLRAFVLALASTTLAVVSVAAAASGRGEAGWVIRDPGTLGREESVAVAVNERGHWATTKTGQTHAVLWTKTGS